MHRFLVAFSHALTSLSKTFPEIIFNMDWHDIMGLAGLGLLYRACCSDPYFSRW